MSATDLSWFIDDRIARELQSVRGVGQINRVGGVNREINVTLDPIRMTALGVARLDDAAGLHAAGADLVVTTLDEIALDRLVEGRLKGRQA